MTTARRAASEALQRWESSRAFADSIVEKVIRSSLEGAEADLAVEIFYGSIRWKARLDFVIDQSSFKIKEMSLRCLLRTGLYQLLYLDRVPEYAAVNETVSLAPSNRTSLVNAFLRSFIRERDKWRQRFEDCRTDKPEVYFSQPGWLIRKWARIFGEDRSRKLLEWNNTIPGVFIRTNTLKCPPEKLQVALKAHEPKATSHPLVFEIGSPQGLFSSEPFRSGWFYVQDPSTLRSVDLLDPQPGESVLDSCSAPGGKTTYIAQRMEDRGRVVASDLDSGRMRLVEENKKRLGCESIEIVSLEALVKSNEAFDRILLDVPCSNSGVLRRRVDLRWRIRNEDIVSLADEQYQLCLRFSKRLKPGGTLVYSTCSLEAEENEKLVERVCATLPSLRLEETWTSFPPDTGMDGAFAAKFSLNKAK